MKKLYLVAAAAMAALSMNAQLYVVGNGSGMSWDLPGQEITANEDGTYTISVSACDQFKVSTNMSTEWDGDGSFNAGAFAPDNATHGFTNAVWNEGGETVNTTGWGENISLPANGRYTITVSDDCTEMNAVANFVKPTAAPDVYLRGDMNSWGAPDNWKFTNVSYDPDTNTGTWEISCTIMAGQAFKIADASWGNINYTTTDAIGYGRPITLIYNNPTNMKLSQNFTGKITFKILGSQSATATFTEDTGAEPTYPENLYIIGTINGGAWDPANVAPMTNEGDGLYTIESVTLAENGGSTGFAITGGGADWNAVNSLRYGPAVTDTPAIIGENTDIALGDLSWSIAPGTYSMQFSMDDMVLEIQKVEGGNPPVDPDPDQPSGEVTTLYVVGAGDGLTWDLPGKAYTGENNIVTFSINNLSKFKASINYSTEWDGEGSYNAGSYGTGTTYFDANKVYPDGQTLPIILYGEDQSLPFEGNYTITYNFNDMTMTVKASSAPSAEAPKVYLRGTMNDWTAPAEWQFTYNEEKDEYIFDCSGSHLIAAGVSFKIADASWGNINFGYNLLTVNTDETIYLDYNGSDMDFAEDFAGTIIFKSTGFHEGYAVFSTSSGVDAVATEAGEAEYYNLQGARVANPDKGIYIRVVNGTATKIVK